MEQVVYNLEPVACDLNGDELFGRDGRLIRALDLFYGTPRVPPQEWWQRMAKCVGIPLKHLACMKILEDCQKYGSVLKFPTGISLSNYTLQKPHAPK